MEQQQSSNHLNELTIDGTIRGIRCPIETQREFYSGHKSVHCLQLQSICFPDGIIGHMLCHLKAGDRCRITTDCNILEQFHNLPYSTGGSYTIYGDSGYPLRPSFMVPYLGAHPTPDLQLHDRVMCSLRICVVWEFASSSNFCLHRFLKESKSFSSTSWSILSCCCDSEELFIMFLWYTNKHLFIFNSSNLRGLFETVNLFLYLPHHL